MILFPFTRAASTANRAPGFTLPRTTMPMSWRSLALWLSNGIVKRLAGAGFCGISCPIRLKILRTVSGWIL